MDVHQQKKWNCPYLIPYMTTNSKEWLVVFQPLSCFWLFVTPWTTACQASLSITNSRSLPKLMSIESVMPSNHLTLCHILLLLLLLLPSIFPRIRVFSNESAHGQSVGVSASTSVLLKGCCWIMMPGFLAPRFLAPGGEEFNPGPETRLNHSELLCNKVLLKYKGDRESFWHMNQNGAERVPLSLISYYSESKECLEVVKTSLDLLP